MASVTLIGWKEVINNWKNFETSGERAVENFLSLIEFTAHGLLKQNTPVDTGALRDSWTTLNKTNRTLVIGVRDDQEVKLHYVVEGTSHRVPNPFMDIVNDSINNLVDSALETELVRSHSMWSSIIGKVNISKTSGLTGTGFSRKRASGSASLRRTSYGLKKLLSKKNKRMRRLGSFAFSKYTKRIR